MGTNLEYKISNVETLSTNDQSVFESHISLLEKPIYSLCKNNPNNNFDAKPIISQKNNYLSNIEKSSLVLLFSVFSYYFARRFEILRRYEKIHRCRLE